MHGARGASSESSFFSVRLLLGSSLFSPRPLLSVYAPRSPRLRLVHLPTRCGKVATHRCADARPSRGANPPPGETEAHESSTCVCVDFHAQLVKNDNGVGLMTSPLCPLFISMALPPPFKAWWLCGLSYARPPPSTCRSFLSVSSSSHARALCPRRSTYSPSSSTSSAPSSASASSFCFASSLSLPAIPCNFLQVSRNLDASPQRRAPSAPWRTSSRSCAPGLSPLAISASTLLPSPSHQRLSSSCLLPSQSPLEFVRCRQASKAPADLAKSRDSHPSAGDTGCRTVSVRRLWSPGQGSSESLGAPQDGQAFCSNEGAFVENGDSEETKQGGGRAMETSQLHAWTSWQQRSLPLNLLDAVSAGSSPVCDFHQPNLFNVSPSTLSPGPSASASSVSSPRSTLRPFSSSPFSPPSPVSSVGCSPYAAMSSCAPLRTVRRSGRLDLPSPPQVEIRRVVVLDKVTRYELELEQRLHVLREREPQEDKPPSRNPDNSSTPPASTPGSLSSLSSSSPSSLSSPSSSSSSSLCPSPSSSPFPALSAGALSRGQREASRLSAETHALAAQLREQMPQAYATHLDHVRNVRELVRQLQDEWGVHTTLIKARSFGNTVSHGRRAVLRKSASAAFPPDAVIAAGGDGTLLEAASFMAALEESQGARAEGPPDGEADEDRALKRKSGETEAAGTGEEKSEAGRGLNSEVRKNGWSFSPDGIWLWGFNTDPVRSEGKLCVAYRPPKFRPRCDNEALLQREGEPTPHAVPEGRNTRKTGRETQSGDFCATGSSSPSRCDGEKTEVEPTPHSQVSQPSSESSAPVAEATAPQRETSFSSNAATACVSPVLSPIDGEHCVQVPTFHPRFITPRRPSPSSSSSTSSSSSSTSSVSWSSTSSGSAPSGDVSEERDAETRSRASRDYVRAVLRYVMDGEGVAICRQRIRVELEYLRAQEADILQRVEQRRREHAGLTSLLPLARVDSAAVSERLSAPAGGGALQRGDAAETGDARQVERRVLGVSALNDVFIGECDSSRTCYAEVKIDQDTPRRYKSSGFLVATGTGSSAWSFNMSKTRTEQVKAVAEELRHSLNLPFDSDAVDWEAVRERINQQLLFHPSMPVMRFFVREPIENSIFSCKGCAGIARRVEVLALSPDAMVAIDGLVSFPLPVGVKLILHISPFDALWTVK
ncbi:DNA-directed RNA polymerase III RPC8 [Toxoplasma gondii MAS]|uniref:DNA-directed RNA polymerase III RPC8 n=2 Tax=Toxoplasma gondii TaxID=5811 RepID=A0A086PZI5_TOXGO|nr:DNA-directed RNA polymerase III RPC8 [Toxoplasma gondii MAS]PUA90416.1 DNA-directed RNA polymerase III RPC8 [Toxoplasma gondii TgCATBr9]